MSDSYLGIYKGVVVDNNDPEFSMRVTCQVPQVLGEAVSNWCDPIQDTLFLPRTGDIVWVQFEDGDPARPLYQSRPVVNGESIEDFSLDVIKFKDKDHRIYVSVNNTTALPVLGSNSPSSGFISWPDFKIQYLGVVHDVPAGNTNKKYTWWDFETGALQFTDVTPTTISHDDLMLFLNKAGVALNVQATDLVDGSLIVPQSILADTIAARQIQTEHLESNLVLSSRIVSTQSTASFDADPPTLSIGAETIGGGTWLVAGTFRWTVTALGSFGETIPSNEVSKAVFATGTEHLSWTRVVGATSYNLYRTILNGDPGSESALVVNVPDTGASTYNYADTGSSVGVHSVPLASRMELNDSIGLQAFSGAGIETVRIDRDTGNASFIGEIGTALPGDIGVFIYSLQFQHFGDRVVTQPIVQFNVGAGRDQPSIQSNNVGTPELQFYSGASSGGRETRVFVGQGDFNVGIEADPDDGIYGGAFIDFQRDGFNVFTDIGMGPSNNHKGLSILQDNLTHHGYQNPTTGALRGFGYLGSAATDSARVYTSAKMDVVDVDSATFKGINASAFTVSSDARSKENPEEVTGALDAVSQLTVYDYETAHGADDGGLRRARGVMAQDVQGLIPNATDEMALDIDGTPMLGVDLYALVSTTLAAVKELNEKFDQHIEDNGARG
jgi:hypothetical protein